MASGTVALPALLPGLDCRFERLEAGDPPVHRAQVTTAQWRAAASAVRAQGGRLISVWGVDRADPAAPTGRQPAVAVTYGLPAGLVWLDLALEYRAGAGGAAALPGYPDLSGLQASGAADARPWLQHGAWPRDYYPLRHRADRPSGAAPRRAADADADNYPFVAVEGDGVHEIAVGPVHAGIIEPGHFRFSVVGEKILRLEERLGYVHKGIEQRFAGTGHIDGAQARALGLTGMAARASGAGTDLREAFGSEPYAGLGVRVARAEGGDVGARVAVRFAEIHESLRLIGRIARELAGGAVHAAFPGAPVRRHGAGWIEGWRGEILVTVELDGAGRIARAHCHDPSWQNWPALAYAVIGNIVPDFPLINKSFNPSYSGQDL